jgi:hypothetical protein
MARAANAAIEAGVELKIFIMVSIVARGKIRGSLQI